MNARSLALVFLSALAISSCWTDSTTPDPPTSQSSGSKVSAAISVDNAPTLAAVFQNQPVALREDTTESKLSARRQAAPTFAFTFQWLSTLPSATVGGYLVQACDIAVEGSRAFVAYNDSGDPFNGAIAVIQLQGNGNAAVEKVVSFSGMDVNVVFADTRSGRVYFGGQADPDRFGFRAFAGWFKNTQLSSESVAGTIVALPSYAATSIQRFDSEIRIATGAADGKLVRLSEDLAILGTTDQADLRSLWATTTHRSTSLFASLTGGADGGTGAVRVETQGASSLFPLPSFRAPYARAAVIAFRGTQRWDDDEDAFVGAALSDQGLRLWRIKDGALDTLWSLANPSTNPMHTTNSLSQSFDVARSESILFVANGEYGLRVIVAGSARNSNGTRDRSKPFARVAGVLPAPQIEGQPRASFNQVVFKDPYLLAATGRSGVQIYRMD
ncbi:MAG: hypothetical protein IPO40_13240 [Fibrobacteres bacterium]|nr:hypothetical protein [Fibrobacterota bacterium]